MKEISALILAVVMCLGLVGCGSNTDSDSSLSSSPSTTPSQAEESPTASSSPSAELTLTDRTVGNMTLSYDSKYTTKEFDSGLGIYYNSNNSFVAITANDIGYNIDEELEGTETTIEDLLKVTADSYLNSIDYEADSLSTEYITLDGQTAELTSCKSNTGNGAYDTKLVCVLVGSYQYYIAFMCQEDIEDADSYMSEFNSLLDSIAFDTTVEESETTDSSDIEATA